MFEELSKQFIPAAPIDSRESIANRLTFPNINPASTPLRNLEQREIGTIEIIHAATFCSGRIVDGEGRINKNAAEYLDELQTLGVSGLYLVGVYKTSVFSELIMPHFAASWSAPPKRPEHVGPSVFAVDELVPGFSIKTWDTLKIISSELKDRGIALIVDFIPNTIGLDSTITRLNPDLISDARAADNELALLKKSIAGAGRPIYRASKISDDLTRHFTEVYRVGEKREIIVHSRFEQSGSSFKFFLDRDLESGFKPHFWLERSTLGPTETFCKELGRDTTSGVVWADVARLKTWSSAVQEQQIGFLSSLSSIVPAVRADMSHLPGHEYWRALTRRAAETNRVLPEIIAETYGFGRHSELASLGINSYANWIREWLNAGRIDLLLEQLYSAPGGAEFLAKSSVVYTANHDDGRGSNNLIEGAKSAIAAVIPARRVMYAQGQRQGDGHRYGADQHVPWADFQERSLDARIKDPDYAEFMEKIVSLSNAAIFRSPESSCSPAKIVSVGGRREELIFHTARELNGERVLAVVDFQPPASGNIRINLAETFRFDGQKISEFKLQNLISGETAPASQIIDLKSAAPGLGYDVYLLRLIRN